MEDLSCWQQKFTLCLYSERLLNKLISYNKQTTNKVNIIQIKKAIYYAKKYHGTQNRRSGEPFYSHPLAVASMVADYCFETEILLVSILHDIIEDTKMTKEKLSLIFDDKIAKQVQQLTRFSLNKKINIEDNIKTLWNSKQYKLLLVKLFDRLHNLQTIFVKSKTKQIKTAKESLIQFLPLSAYFNLYDIEKEIANYCVKSLISNNSEAKSPRHFFCLESLAALYLTAQSAE